MVERGEGAESTFSPREGHVHNLDHRQERVQEAVTR